MQRLKRKVPDGISALTWVLLCAGCVWVVLSVPRPVLPDRPPPLLLPRAAVEAVLVRDAQLQARQPDDLASTRARALLRVDAALGGEIREADRTELGRFIEVLRAHHAVRADRFVAPRFVIRVLYAADWNQRRGLPAPEGFWPVERQAYFGWLGMRAANLPLAERMAALEAYAAAGGLWADEAHAYLALIGGRPEVAVSGYAAAYRKQVSWRLRNHGIAAHARSGPME